MVLIDANSRAQNTQSVMVNVSYALDSMTREIRTGSDFFCGASDSLPTSGSTSQDCSSGATAFSFNEGGQSLTKSASSRRVGFRLASGVMERRLGNGDWTAVTSPDINLSELRFVASGTTRLDGEAPTVTVYLKGIAGAGDDLDAEFDIQTTVVQQLLDI